MGVAEREDDDDIQLQQPPQDADPNDPPQDDPQDPPQGADPSDPPNGGADEEEDVITLGSEEPPASEEATAAPWVKELRRTQRELRRENAELKAKLGSGQPGFQQKPTLPTKPKMSDADIDYDEEKFEQARDAWEAKKREIDAWEANQRSAQEEQEKRVQKVNEAYNASKASLKVKDFDDAEDAVLAALPEEWKQGVLKVGPANPGVLVYALGKNPKKLQELASIKDPVKFAVAVGKLETEVKVTKRTSTKPAPETTVKGGGSTSSATSKATLERLEAEAERTGDRSKVIAYKRAQRQQGQK